MKKHLKFAGKCVILICILCVCIKSVYQIITPKIFYQEMLSTTLSYTNFYDMEENTIDVLFLGSSISATSYIPQELYNRYGITSYNLGSEKQSPVISYFWLKEALRYQQPKVLVLDGYFFFKNNDDILNTNEVCIRRALDYMKWSSVKREAIQTICELDDSQSLFSYYFPNIRYHTRWMELTEDDFLFLDMVKQYKHMGYAPLAGNCKADDYVPYGSEVTEEETDIMPLMKEYLDKILQLCEQNDISLVLTNVPILNPDKGKFNAIQKYADEHNLLFVDFNEEKIYREIDFNFSEDSYDTAHTNLWGAEKITDYIGKILANQYQIAGKYDEQWESTKTAYEEMKKDCELVRMTDIDEYMTALKDDRYSVFVSAKGFYSKYLREETIDRMKELGLQVNLQTDPSQESFYYYFAVISDGVIEENIGYDNLDYANSVCSGLTAYNITGAGSIQIENKEKAVGKNGLNIVVYNNNTRKVIDSVCFNTSAEENTAIRRVMEEE